MKYKKFGRTVKNIPSQAYSQLMKMANESIWKKQPDLR